jgi:hypothetical protein
MFTRDPSANPDYVRRLKSEGTPAVAIEIALMLFLHYEATEQLAS